MDENDLRPIIEDFIEQLKAILATIPEQAEVVAPVEDDDSLLTKRAMIELVSHEGIVREAYKDSKGIWTWGIGVTDASGHKVLRYKDNPQSIAKVVEIFKWLVETKYLPDVLKAFEGYELSEEQLAAAVSFHYNTGAIKKASWVKSFKAGNMARAKVQIMDWKKPVEIIPRRMKERDLFFDGKWSNKGLANVYTKVRKPSYVPVWSSLTKINIEEEL